MSKFNLTKQTIDEAFQSLDILEKNKTEKQAIEDFRKTIYSILDSRDAIPFDSEAEVDVLCKIIDEKLENLSLNKELIKKISRLRQVVLGIIHGEKTRNDIEEVQTISKKVKSPKITIKQYYSRTLIEDFKIDIENNVTQFIAKKNINNKIKGLSWFQIYDGLLEYIIGIKDKKERFSYYEISVILIKKVKDGVIKSWEKLEEEFINQKEQLKESKKNIILEKDFFNNIEIKELKEELEKNISDFSLSNRHEKIFGLSFKQLCDGLLISKLGIEKQDLDTYRRLFIRILKKIKSGDITSGENMIEIFNELKNKYDEKISNKITSEKFFKEIQLEDFSKELKNNIKIYDIDNSQESINGLCYYEIHSGLLNYKFGIRNRIDRSKYEILGNIVLKNISEGKYKSWDEAKIDFSNMVEEKNRKELNKKESIDFIKNINVDELKKQLKDNIKVFVITNKNDRVNGMCIKEICDLVLVNILLKEKSDALTISKYRGTVLKILERLTKEDINTWKKIKLIFLKEKRILDDTKDNSKQLEIALKNKESQGHKQLQQLLEISGSYSLVAKYLENKYGESLGSEYEAQMTLKEQLGVDRIGTFERGGNETDEYKVGTIIDIEHLLKDDLVYEYFKESYMEYIFSYVEKSDLAFFAKIKKKLKTLDNNSVAKRLIEEAMEYYEDLLTLETSEKFREKLRDSNFKIRKFPSLHQLLACKKLAEENRILIAEGTGAGKTASAMFAREQKETGEKFGHAPKTLVICPSSAIQEVWVDRLDKYYKPENTPSHQVLNHEVLTSENFELKDYNIMSYNTLEDINMNELKNLGIEYIIVDEGQNIKNTGGKWYNRALELVNTYETRLEKESKEENKEKKLQLMMLSATPFTNHITKDINYVLKLLGYLPEGVRFVKNLLKTSPGEISDLLRPKMLRHDRSAILSEVPENTEKTIICDMGENEEKLFDLILSMKDVWHQLKIFNYLQLLTINPDYVFKRLKTESLSGELIQSDQNLIKNFEETIKKLEKVEFENTKIKLLKKEINKKISLGENKILIFTSNITEGILKHKASNYSLSNLEIRDLLWLNEGETITKAHRERAKELLDKQIEGAKLELEEEKLTHEIIAKEYGDKGYNTIFIDQRVPKHKRKEMMEAEHKDPSKKTILFMTGPTCSEAIDATFASNIIKLNPAWTKKEEEQIVGRIDRPGQKRPSEFIRLIVGKFDEAIYKYANWKDEIIEKITSKGEAQSKVDLQMLESGPKLETISAFIETLTADKFNEAMIFMIQRMVHYEKGLDTKIFEWQEAIKNNDEFSNETKNIISWYKKIENSSYKSNELIIFNKNKQLLEKIENDPNYTFKNTIEFVAKEILEKIVKKSLNELSMKNKNYKNKSISVKIASLFDDVMSGVDLIISYEGTGSNQNKYIGVDVFISGIKEKIEKKSESKHSRLKEFNLYKGLSENEQIPRFVLPFEPEMFAKFLYSYLTKIESGENIDICELFYSYLDNKERAKFEEYMKEIILETFWGE